MRNVVNSLTVTKLKEINVINLVMLYNPPGRVPHNYLFVPQKKKSTSRRGKTFLALMEKGPKSLSRNK